MSDDPALFPQILTGDAVRAYEAHSLQCSGKAGDALGRLLRDERFSGLPALQDTVWDLALDFVAPLEPYVRDALRAAGTGLPWAGRGDIELYWKLMYAAHIDRMTDEQDDRYQGQPLRRPVKEIVSVTAKLLNVLRAAQEGGSKYWEALSAQGSGPVGHALYIGIVERAGRQIRLRSGLLRVPKPLGIDSRVRVDDVMAQVCGYALGGDYVIVSRETEPLESAGLDWKLDVRIGRWTASAPPWRVEALL